MNKQKSIKVIKVYLWLFCALFLSGCQTILQNIPSTYDLSQPSQIKVNSQGHGVVFGEIQFSGMTGAHILTFDFIDSDKKEYTAAGDQMSFREIVRSIHSNKWPADYFFLSIPAGEYKIVKITGDSRQGTITWVFSGKEFKAVDIINSNYKYHVGTSDITASFSVESNAIIYLGELVLECASYLGSLHVYNDSENAIGELQKRYPKLTSKVKTSLLQLKSLNPEKKSWESESVSLAGIPKVKPGDIVVPETKKSEFKPITKNLTFNLFDTSFLQTMENKEINNKIKQFFLKEVSGLGWNLDLDKNRDDPWGEYTMQVNFSDIYNEDGTLSTKPGELEISLSVEAIPTHETVWSKEMIIKGVKSYIDDEKKILAELKTLIIEALSVR